MVVFIGSSAVSIGVRAHYEHASSAFTTDDSPDIIDDMGGQSGDFAIITAMSHTTGSYQTPSGWTRIMGHNEAVAGNDHLNLCVLTKLLDGTETTIAPFQLHSGARMWQAMFWQGVTGMSTIGVDTEFTGSNPSSQIIALNGDGVVPCIGYAIAAATIDSPNTFTPAFSTFSPAATATYVVSDGVNRDGMIVGYKYYASAPSDVTVDMNDIGTAFAAQRNLLGSVVINFT